jgi:hypothetical protein
MNRRGASFLVIPLLAALALFYPVGTRTGSISPASTHPPQPRTPSKAESGITRPREWRGGRESIQRFFGFSDQAATYSWPNETEDPRRNATLKFLIATVPDPIDSGLPHAYDRYLAAIEAAVQREQYVLSDFDLPWEDCLPRNKEQSAQGVGNNLKIELPGQAAVSLSGNDEKCSRRFAAEPGLLLLTNPSQKSSTDLLLIYLVGETPKTGIQKEALIAALDEIAATCNWRKPETAAFPGATWPKPPCADAQISILGPSFTGSAQSLDLVLSRWLDSQPASNPALKLRLISGSATGISVPAANAPATPDDIDFYNLRHRLPGPRFSFHSMENPDTSTVNRFMSYLAEQSCINGGTHAIKAAILIEDTPYGTNIAPNAKRQPAQKREPQKNTGCPGQITISENNVHPTFIPYPLHISQLRAASAKLRRSQSETTPQPQPQTEVLPLADSLEELGARRDVETFSPANAVTAERVMANILSTISREGYKYVGIVATDVRDAMFLAREVHEHSPKAVLFTFNADLLYLHPDINASLRGMLVVSSYPLDNHTQLWTFASHPGMRLQFPDDGTEGTYNAALALLGDDADLLDYSLPFPGNSFCPRPPMWISVVGKDRLWPVLAIDLGDQNYTYVPSAHTNTSSQVAVSWDGVYPESTSIFMAVFVSFCIVFCIPLLRRDQVAGWLDRSWLGVVMAPPVSEKYRRNGELFLIVGCSSLAAFLIVALPALAAPVATIWLRSFGSPTKPNTFEIVAAALFTIMCALIAVLLPLSMVSLFRALRPGRERGFIGHFRFNPAAWLPMVLGCFTVLTCAFIFLARWTIRLASKDFQRGLLASIRFLDLAGGVSPLVPLLLVSLAAFLWATSSFHRLRMMEGLGSSRGFLAFAGRFRDIHAQEKRLRYLLIQPSWRFRGFAALTLLVLISILYFFLLQLVPSFEDCWFYWLLGASYLFVSLALWLGVLRFLSVWNQTRHMLQHLTWTAMRSATKRFHANFPSMPKIDLAMDAPSLAPVALSLDLLQTIFRRALRLAKAPAGPTGGFSLEMTVESSELEAKGKLEGVKLSDPERTALVLLSSPEVARRIENAQAALREAKEQDAERSVNASLWRTVLENQCSAQEDLADLTAVVSEALQLDWWKEIRPSTKNSETSSPAADVFQLCEQFLAGRLAHFLSHVFPQMGNMIFTSVAGILLMLFAVSSYPLQPHNQLLYFSWIIVLSFVGIALGVFVQINRNPILSMLNGTTPGRITWDREFILRIFFYGVVPILALLGVQFPDTIREILTRIAPAEAMHP